MQLPVVNADTMRIRQRSALRSKCWLRVALILLAGLVIPTTLLAQTGENPETVRVESDLVDLQVAVLSHKSSALPSLRQGDFTVIEDGVPQEITFFQASDSPFDLVLLLDLSGSISEKLKLVRRSAKRFVDAARPLDRIAILSFTDTVQVISQLSSNHEELKKAIDDIEKPMGGTNFWDALHYVLTVLGRPGAASRRSAVVVMTDGVDNALPDVFGDGSQTTFDELLTQVKRSSTIIFPIYLDTEKEEIKLHRNPKSAFETARAQLTEIAEVSGTVMYRADKVKDLEEVYSRVIRDLGTVYSIGYQPRNAARDGKWRSVKVELVNHPDLGTRTRSGYYAKAVNGDSPHDPGSKQ